MKREREGERGKEKIIRKDRKELLMKRPAKVRSMWEKETEAVVLLKDPIDSLFFFTLFLLLLQTTTGGSKICSNEISNILSCL